MREAHAFLREPIEVRSLVRGAAVAGEALDPEIIGEDQQDVGLLRSGGLYDTKSEEKEWFHTIEKSSAMLLEHSSVLVANRNRGHNLATY